MNMITTESNASKYASYIRPHYITGWALYSMNHATYSISFAASCLCRQISIIFAAKEQPGQ
jgi:hypothetical protein